MAVNRTFKIPRNILAEITRGNPQAIKAFENIEVVANETPGGIEEIIIQIGEAIGQANQAATMANQAVAVIKQAISDIEPVLYAVGVPQELTDYLGTVNVPMVDNQQLNGVGYYFEPASDNMMEPVAMR